MIRLSANVSKKVPLPGVEYSSQSFSAGMEIELASNVKEDELRQRFQALYGLLERSIDEQIQQSSRGVGAGLQAKDDGKAPGRTSQHQRNGRNGNGRAATQAQIKAIYAIARDRGHSEQDLSDLLSGQFRVTMPEELSIGQASTLIDSLKSGKAPVR